MKYSHAQSGIGVRCGAGSDAQVGTFGGVYSLTAGAFALVLPIMFLGRNENYFFGGVGAGSRDMFLIRNLNDSKNGTLDLIITDASGNQLTATWNAHLEEGTQYILVVNVPGPGEGALQLYTLNSTEVEQTAENYDEGFAPETDFTLAFGEVEAGKIDEFIFSGPIAAYSRALTATEILELYRGIMPNNPISIFSLPMPHRGLNEALPTWVNQ